MDALKVKRELDALDALEKRVKGYADPSPVLLREIDKKRKELLNPVAVEPKK